LKGVLSILGVKIPFKELGYNRFDIVRSILGVKLPYS